MPAQHFRRRIFSAVPLLFYYSNRNPLVTSFNVLLDNGRIPVALTNESSCSADCSQGYGHKFFIASQQPATL